MSTKVQAHPVAAFLTDEMRARIRAARFVRNDDPDREWCATVVAEVDGRTCCPIGVALGGGTTDWECFPISDRLWDAVAGGGVTAKAVINAARSFIKLVDNDEIQNPDDVYVMLGVDPPDDGPADAGVS